jgi:hypothetical protein
MDASLCPHGIDCLITVTDLCDPEFCTPLQQDGLVCYTRLFLETILQDTHERVIVHIVLKSKADALYKETNGFTDQYMEGRFNIVIYAGDLKTMISTLSHELVHVKQHLEDGFKIDRAANAVYWENHFYMSLSSLVRLHKDKQYELYAMLPWETEATLSLPAIHDIVTKKMETILKTDPYLHEFFRKSVNDSSYNTDRPRIPHYMDGRDDI